MKEARRIRKRLDAAREGLFPAKTCPASRHVHMIVEALLESKNGYGADLRRLGYEPEHLAGSIASVLEGLWNARRWMKWQPNIEGNYMAGGEWVPDMDAILQAQARSPTLDHPAPPRASKEDEGGLAAD